MSEVETETPRETLTAMRAYEAQLCREIETLEDASVTVAAQSGDDALFAAMFLRKLVSRKRTERLSVRGAANDLQVELEG